MRTTTLYVLKNLDGAVLYVGISHVPWNRMDQHRDKPWWQDVAAADFTHYPTRRDAEHAERTLITALRPPGNTVWMPRSPSAHPSMLSDPSAWAALAEAQAEAAKRKDERTAEELANVTVYDDGPISLDDDDNGPIFLDDDDDNAPIFLD